jgi:uncharacterized membrane protein YdjX (TVP38/TMEM64 family)
MSTTRRSFIYQFVSLALLVVTMVLIARYVPMLRVIGNLQEQLRGLGLAAPVAYPAIIAVANLLLMPGGILSVGGGFFFGLPWGFTLVMFGNFLSAAGAFQIARKLGRKRMERLVQRRAKWEHLDETIEREGWKIVVLTQLHPFFPVSLINYMYGITSIRFWPCMFWTLIGRAPGVLLYVYLGTLGQFGINLVTGRNRPRTVEYLAWGGGLLLLIVLTLLLARLATRLLTEAEAKAKRDQLASAADLRSSSI